jgi:multiple sugar transport system substrate-binding protein
MGDGAGAGPGARLRASRRTLGRAALTLPAGAALAACGQAAPGGAQTAPAPGRVQGKVLAFAYQKTSPGFDRQKAMYDDFNKEFQPKGLEVELVNPGDEIVPKATALHVAGTPADMWEHPRLWRELEGLIADVTPFMRRDKVDEKQWIPESIGAMKDGSGKVWGIPVSISTDALAYNLDLFEQAGLKPPPVDPDDRSWTMDLFLDTAKKLTKGPQQFGMQGKFSGAADWVVWPSWFGYGTVDLQAKKVTINAPGYQQALQFWVDTSLKHHVQPTTEELNALRATPNQDPFLTGKVGMVGMYALAERPQFRWGVAAMPYTPNPQQPKNIAGSLRVHAVFMDSTSKNKDQTWEVFKYWMDPEHDAKYVLSDGHIIGPLVKGGSEATMKEFKDRYGADPKAFLLMAQHTRLDGWGYFLVKDWAKARAAIDAIFADVKSGKMSVPEFSQQAQDLFERLASF